ncbi:hypothetical protein Godav_011683 [Gossypium davidsonii]|uniref:Zinc knuckle CX2CX4HX4C domain-containing protein n=2 Tax=Gossypium TaxID=3633 RepID=A0A7J8RC77_GOSDV|nr:hypothetical protein [Gossypium davidsonii]
MSGAESLSNDQIGEGEDSTADRNTKKVWFKDESDDSLANMVVDSSPVSGVSWKDKLLGGSVSNSLDGVANLDLEFEDGDIRRSNLNGIPAIDFSDRIAKILIKGKEFTVVVKLLGRNIGYGALYNHSLSRSVEIPVLEKDLRGDWKKTTYLSSGRLQRVEFEALPDVCLSCGKYGHLKNLYPSSLTDRSSHGGEEIPKSPLSSETASANKRDALSTIGEAFGP